MIVHTCSAFFRHNAIYTLEGVYRYEMLVGAIVDERLPDTLRAAFAQLILRLWVDRYPHMPLKLPGCVYRLSKESTDQTESFHVA